MKRHNLRSKFLTVLGLGIGLLLLSGCSSSEEAEEPADTASESSSGDRDCTQFTNEVDITECELWNSMH